MARPPLEPVGGHAQVKKIILVKSV